MIAALTLAGVLIANAAQAGIAGDANCNGVVDDQDIGALIERGFDPSDCTSGDANQDGVVNAADLPALLTTVDAGGPIVTFLGLASAAGDLIASGGVGHNGLPVFVRPVGVGFKLVVEGAAGASGKAVGHITDAQVGRPDLQAESERTLGDGSFDRCPGPVPGITPPNFGAGSTIDQALRAFACSFEIMTTRTAACTLDGFGNANWVAAESQTQFCTQIDSARQFAAGQTRLTVRLRDVDGNLGPIQSIIVQIGTAPPPTATRSGTPTAAITATRTLTPTPGTTSPTKTVPTSTRAPSASPTGTGTALATATPSATITTTPRTVPSSTATAPATPPSASPTATNSATATLSFTPSATPRNPTATPTPTRTSSPIPTPTVTATNVPSNTPTFTASRTSTRTPTPTPSLSATPTLTRTTTNTPTLTPTRTPAAGSGPVITFFGLATAENTVITPIATTTASIPVYRGGPGFGFTLVVEARPGTGKQPVAGQTFKTDPTDPTVQPDLQIEVSNPLGDGSTAVCDNAQPTVGGVPAVDPPDFGATQTVSDALNDLGCRFEDGTGQPGARSSAYACTVFSDGNFGFVCGRATNPGCTQGVSTLQFCAQIIRPLTFQSGDTLVTVQVLDTAGNSGPPAQLIIRR